MADKVDVLAVMDRCAEWLEQDANPAGDLKDARAAVAGLMQTAKACADDLELIFDGQADYCSESGANDAMKADLVVARLRAALARIGGAP